LVRNLPLEGDSVVADIGAGTGYFSFRIAERVPRGRVLAVDIQPEMLDIIEARKDSGALQNVETVLGTEKDPRLPAASVDLILLVDAYHEFAWPREMGLALFQALRPGGALVLVEYRGEDPSVPIKRLHKMTRRQAIDEMQAVGLRWERTERFLPQQHFMVFRRPAETYGLGRYPFAGPCAGLPLEPGPTMSSAIQTQPVESRDFTGQHCEMAAGLPFAAGPVYAGRRLRRL
jgi:ubiquinone/menaquinone biosynthesis C-methylase UbiE